jgi:hypothetical protein
MTVEDAAKIIISAGMINPETQARLRKLAEKPNGAPQESAPAQSLILSWSGLSRSSSCPLAREFADGWILGTSPRLSG